LECPLKPQKMVIGQKLTLDSTPRGDNLIVTADGRIPPIWAGQTNFGLLTRHIVMYLLFCLASQAGG